MRHGQGERVQNLNANLQDRFISSNLVYGVLCHFQQYFSYILAETGVLGENHWPAVSHWQTLSHNVVSNLAMNGVQTHNFSGISSIYV